jgi:hypothetical protein
LSRKLFSFRWIFNRDGYIVRRSTEAGEQTPSDILQQNKRIDWLSNACLAVGAGLLLAGIGRWATDGCDGYTIFWLVIGGVLLLVSRHVLGLLEAEK